jgi:WD40 repeat protein
MVTLRSLLCCVGAIDGKLRVWSITEARVLAVVQLHQDMVTALAFSCDGSRVVAGTMRGRCRFYDHTETRLEYVASVSVYFLLSWLGSPGSGKIRDVLRHL